MVNWSPVLQTAISDLEVEMRTVAGKLYHLAYPIEGSEEKLVVATTRPETMLGDTAVAMHPADERYRHLRGKSVVLPIQERLIPIIEDEHVDPEFGTGLVKITPYHDPNDFEMGQRHGLPGIRVIGFDGKMTAEAGVDFEGLDRFEARRRVVERFEAAGLLVEIEKHSHNVGHSQRGGEPVEPMVSTQWFLDASEMAGQALAAVRDGEMKLVPPSYDKTWEHWLENIRPWCVSRQLWWGHQIPAWYDKDGNVFVARSREAAEQMAGTDQLEQDPDVLDTWFSSGLWPMSTLGWPDDSDDLKTFFPTQVLITGFDILFFWVARMAMMSLNLTGKIPFEAVHLTGLVRDKHGKKISKTAGNGIDPLEMVDEFGADALRFTLAIMDIPGRDIPLDPQRMAGYRAFGNKIWNATRFALSRIGDARLVSDGDDLDVGGASGPPLELPERFILSRLEHTIGEVNRRLEEFRFDEACNALYHFFWHELCDWYIEFAKPALSAEAPRPRVGEVLLYVLDRSLRLLHPVMPHLTEEVWHRLPGFEVTGFECLAIAAFPESSDDSRASYSDAQAEAEMAAVIDIITASRGLRKELKLESSQATELFVEGGPEELVDAVIQNAALVQFLGKVNAVTRGPAPEDASRDLISGIEVAFAVEAREVLSEDRERLEKELSKIEGEIRGARSRLENPKFLANAPDDVVLGNRERLAELEDRKLRIEADLG
jgi:valyl-tRNA synthetase